MLDGAQLAAQAVGADELIVCVCETARTSVETSAHAIAERRGMPSDCARMHLTAVPGSYVAGQEAALVNHLNGGPAIPTFTPPMVFEQGVRRRPTLVANAETLAHVALIARHGPEWFRQLGTPSQPGSALVTLSGALAHPGVYEIEHGASLRSLIDAAGGTLTSPRALLVGGYGGSWIGGEYLRGVALSDEHLAPHGASLGAGVVLLLSHDACPVAETARVARWLAGTERRAVRTVRARAGLDRRLGRRDRRRTCPGEHHPAHRAPGRARAPSRRLRPSRRDRAVRHQRARRVRARVRRPRPARALRGMRPSGRAAAARPSPRRDAHTRTGVAAMSQRVRVNPIACEAHGMCAELLPERITLDDWGYPIVDSEPLPPALLDHARRAAQACPTFALLLTRDREP